MAIETSYSDARARLAQLLDAVVEDRETVIIHRRGSRDVAMIAVDELAGLMETAHLMRSPRNAARLVSALERAMAGRGRSLTAAQLRRRVGLDAQER